MIWKEFKRFGEGVFMALIQFILVIIVSERVTFLLLCAQPLFCLKVVVACGSTYYLYFKYVSNNEE